MKRACLARMDVLGTGPRLEPAPDSTFTLASTMALLTSLLELFLKLEG